MRPLVMRQFAWTAVAALMLGLLPVNGAYAQGARERRGIAIPIAGSGANAAFNGTFTLREFARSGNNVVALGILSGQVTNTATGVVTSVVQNVAMPVQAGSEAAAVSAAAVTAQHTCDVLNLVLGPLHLDVLGLVIDLNQVVLNITAEAGPGNLLGNLLCAVVGLLDNPGGNASQIGNLLNQVLAILQ